MEITIFAMVQGQKNGCCFFPEGIHSEDMVLAFIQLALIIIVSKRRH